MKIGMFSCLNKKYLLNRMEANSMKCLVEVWNSALNKSEWLEGEVIREVQRIDLDRNGYNVKINDGSIFEGCHPDCVKFK
jgi:hypothetical protein